MSDVTIAENDVKKVHTPGAAAAHSEPGEALEAVFARQQAAVRARSEHPTLETRLDALKRLETWILANRQRIRDALHADFRKPPTEVDLTDTKPVLLEIKEARKNLRQWMEPRKVGAPLLYLGTRSRVTWEPKGVTLILAPWNFPFMLTIAPLVSALAAGNTAILKPSELTPNTSALIDHMVKELFSPDEVAVCLGDAGVAAKLTDLPFDHIFFTGSPAVGRLVMAAAAKNLSSVTLELGGMNPVVVDETANLKDTARRIVWGKFLNSGQTCLSPNYLLAHQSIHDALLDALKNALERMYPDLKNSADGKVGEMARIVNAHHYRRVRALLDDSVAAGAKIHYGGGGDADENYIQPTILTHVPEGAPVLHEEIFGPVLPVLSYANREEAIKMIAARPKPLALYVFTKDASDAEPVFAACSAGTSCINDTTLHFGHPKLPFGGVNESGIGNGHGHAGFIEFSNERAILQQKRGLTMANLLYPPYRKSVKALADLVVRWL